MFPSPVSLSIKGSTVHRDGPQPEEKVGTEPLCLLHGQRLIRPHHALLTSAPAAVSLAVLSTCQASFSPNEFKGRAFMPILRMEKLTVGEEKLGNQEKVLILENQRAKVQKWRRVLHE